MELSSLHSLQDLNVRRNQLSTLPDGKEREADGVPVSVYVSVRACVCPCKRVCVSFSTQLQ